MEKKWPKEVKKRVNELRLGWKQRENLVDARTENSGLVKKRNASLTLDTRTLIDYFLHFYPGSHVRSVVIPETNATGMVNEGSDWEP